ncbi:MAG: flavodoxin family protein [Candidatus Aminicenantes bacterium]|nr:flavodoxin family protein [Candidatus Aminicenantes bacterium]
MKENTAIKVTAFIGSARKEHTYNATELFLQKLKSLGDIEYEIVRLSDYDLGTCKGCRVCFDKGEEFCQFKDDRDVLIDKIMNSDGVIFASPNYSFQVSALMKIFLDRLGFVFHRPRFFGKAFTSIVAQGIYGGSKIVNYFNFIGNALGFNVVNGCCINSLEPVTEKGRKKIDKIIDRQSKRFYAKLIRKEYPAPSLLKLMVFRAGRSSMKLMLNGSDKDYRYYKEKGWFEADYYYPVKLNQLKKLTGKIFDRLGTQMARNH